MFSSETQKQNGTTYAANTSGFFCSEMFLLFHTHHNTLQLIPTENLTFLLAWFREQNLTGYLKNLFSFKLVLAFETCRSIRLRGFLHVLCDKEPLMLHNELSTDPFSKELFSPYP